MREQKKYRIAKNLDRSAQHGKRVAFRKGTWSLLLIVVAIAGIYRGKFTPTEAAAMPACLTNQGLGQVVFVLRVNFTFILFGRGQFHGCRSCLTRQGTDPVFSRRENARGVSALWHPEGRHHGRRSLPFTGWPEPARGFGHHENGHYRTRRGRLAVSFNML